MGDREGTGAGAIAGPELEAALTAAGIGIWSWTIADDRLRWTGPAAQLFGLPSESFEGTLRDFHERLHPADVERVRRAVDAAVESRAQDYAMEYRVPQADGSVRWLLSRGRVVVDDDGAPTGMTGAITDVTDQKLALERAIASEERMKIFSKLASDYIYVVDFRQPTLAPSIVAGAFERTTGFTPEEVAERGGWLKVMHPDDAARASPLVDELKEGRPFIHEYRIITKDGRTRWLRDRALPDLDPETGELVGITGGVRDVTERKVLEERLMHAQKMEALAHLAGAVAHDFNNLLTVMYGAASMLRVDPKSPREQDALAHIESATDHAAELTRSLLTFGRRQVAEPRVIRLSDLPRRSASMLKRAAGERVKLVLTDISDGARVAVDPSQLDLALLNLVVNARDAMHGGGTIVVTTGVTVLAEGDPERPAELAPGRYASLEVRDDGSGIPPDALGRVFEPFFTTKAAGKGTGLGLATVHGVVLQHKGAIMAKSVLDRGTAFVIYLPLSSGTLDEPRAEETLSAVGGTERILVIEDEPLVRATTVLLLEELHYDVTDVGSAEDALECEGPFDLVLSDVRLPGISGTELALEWRRRGTPVLLMSGFVDDAQRNVIADQALPFIGKPFTGVGLARRVREVLERDGASTSPK